MGFYSCERAGIVYIEARMLDTAKKAWVLLRKRPLHFFGVLGQYWRFLKSRWKQRFYLTPSRGVHLGSNVRIQNVHSLSAERPNARIEVGEDTVIYEKAAIEAYGSGQISIGGTCIIGEARISARESIRIGQRVVTSWNVYIQDFDGHPTDPETRRIQMLNLVEDFRPSYRASRKVEPLRWTFPTAPIEIGDDVWLGANTTVLKGAKIGSGSIVAAGAVVAAGTYPPRSVLGGIPAKVIKTL